MTRFVLAAALALAPFAASLAADKAYDKPAEKPARSAPQCWRSGDFDGFTAVSDHAFNMRTRDGRYWRIETGACPNLRDPQARLVTVVRGSDMICQPVDWDLRVAEGGGPIGFAMPCIVQSQRLLTPEEAAAIPKREKP